MKIRLCTVVLMRGTSFRPLFRNNMSECSRRLNVLASHADSLCSSLRLARCYDRSSIYLPVLL
jgi:hypothetical protein